MATISDDLTLLKCSLQRALVGEVTANLFAVTAGIYDHLILVIAYFLAEVSESDIDTIQCVGTEVIADFPEPYMIEEAWFSIRDREPQMLQFWAFKRKREDIAGMSHMLKPLKG